MVSLLPSNQSCNQYSRTLVLTRPEESRAEGRRRVRWTETCHHTRQLSLPAACSACCPLQLTPLVPPWLPPSSWLRWWLVLFPGLAVLCWPGGQTDGGPGARPPPPAPECRPSCIGSVVRECCDQGQHTNTVSRSLTVTPVSTPCPQCPHAGPTAPALAGWTCHPYTPSSWAAP